MDSLFEMHKLNTPGMVAALDIADAFNELLIKLGTLCPLCPMNVREMAIVRTKLEEACFFAKKAMANLKENQAQD